MEFGISHDWSEETPEARARWFQTLSVEERVEVFLAITEAALALNPSLADKPLPEPNDWNQGRILVLQLPDDPRPNPPASDQPERFIPLF